MLVGRDESVRLTRLEAMLLELAVREHQRGGLGHLEPRIRDSGERLRDDDTVSLAQLPQPLVLGM